MYRRHGLLCCELSEIMEVSADEENLVKRVRVPALALVLVQENAGREECHAR